VPVLDGGHLFFLAVEKVRGRPLSFKVEHAVTNVGMAILLSLAAFVTYNDIMRAISERLVKGGG
jgi:regulator of sigma E protease